MNSVVKLDTLLWLLIFLRKNNAYKSSGYAIKNLVEQRAFGNPDLLCKFKIQIPPKL